MIAVKCEQMGQCDRNCNCGCDVLEDISKSFILQMLRVKRVGSAKFETLIKINKY
jgi:hypothetical protein